MATISTFCFGLVVFFVNFMPLALPMQSADSKVSVTLSQALGALMQSANPAHPQWKMEAKNGCRNDLVETNSVHLKMEKGSIKVRTLTGAPIHCGTPLAFHNLTIQTQFENDLRTPSSTEKGQLATLPNFDDAIILPTVGDGYGNSVHYEQQSIFQISLAENVSDHTIVGSAHVGVKSEKPTIASARMTVYQNVLQLIATSEIKDLVFAKDCCTPIGGKITTHFESGKNIAPTDAGLSLIGKEETLTFHGCGSAQLKDGNGQRSNISVACF